MKYYRVIILPSAELDMGTAYAWLVERDAEAAIRWFNRLLEVIDSLEIFPERCPLAPEISHFKKEIRQILHGHKQHKYRVLFDIEDDAARAWLWVKNNPLTNKL